MITETVIGVVIDTVAHLVKYVLLAFSGLINFETQTYYMPSPLYFVLKCAMFNITTVYPGMLIFYAWKQFRGIGD